MPLTATAKNTKAQLLRVATNRFAQNVLLSLQNRIWIHELFLSWRETTLKSRKAIMKRLNRVLYVVSQRHRKARLARFCFSSWAGGAAEKKTMLLRSVICPMCELTEPPGLERGSWAPPHLAASADTQSAIASPETTPIRLATLSHSGGRWRRRWTPPTPKLRAAALPLSTAPSIL